VISVMHGDPICIGVNCALEPARLGAFLCGLSGLAPFYVHACLNSGPSSAQEGYDEDPESYANSIMPFIENRLLNIIGGTTPSHIQILSKRIKHSKPPRQVPEQSNKMLLSGL
jgi:5-methyltetrahydrofolate--homocysteine methyltransferase